MASRKIEIGLKTRLDLVPQFLAVCATVGLVIGGPPQSAMAEVSADGAAQACQIIGAWLEPDTGETVAAKQLLTSMAERRIVLLGESHTNVEHHLWQLHTLAGLHAHRSRLVVGFEMFPRAVQPALDAWSKGRHTEADFLEASRWREVWGYGPELYLPLFHFVRQNRLPMIALNVDRELVSHVGQKGWSAVPEDAREGISDPAPASDAYRQSLAKVYAAKQKQGVKNPSPHGGGDGPQGDEADEEPDLVEILESADFVHFVEAQLTWDRAMAEALFKASRENPEALVVGVLGRGLGEDSVAILLPVETGSACEALEPNVADAVFVMAPSEDQQMEPARPRLGVMIEQAEGGVRILEVIEGSVAEATGLAAGDIIVSAATFPIGRVSDLIEIVQRQAPGTWLPLEIKRNGKAHRLVAEFPSRFE
jgi:uncharacterized iron-regulated protein